MRQRTRWLVLVVFVLGWVFSATPPLAGAQGPEGDAATRLILNNINEARIPDNISPLAFNCTLNRIALAHAYQLASRPLDRLGDILAADDGTRLTAWLQADWNAHQTDGLGFAPYSDGFFADSIVLIVRDIPPADVVRYWTTQLQPTDPVRSLIYDFRYREIGIAYVHDANTGRHYYVLIFGSRPNFLPVMVTQRTSFDFSNTIIPVRDVTLYIHNEFSHTNGDNEHIGAVRDIRVAEDLETLMLQPWGPYTNRYPYTISVGFGLKTIYVELRDAFDRTTLMQTSVTYTDSGVPLPSPTAPVPLPPSPTVAAIAVVPSETPAIPTATSDLSATLSAMQTSAAVATQTANAIAATNQYTVNLWATGTAAVLETMAAAAEQTQTAQASPTEPPKMGITLATPTSVAPVPATPTATPQTPADTPLVNDVLIYTPTTVTPTFRPVQTIDLAWTADFLVLSNPAATPLDLGGLQFNSTGHSFNGSEWTTSGGRVVQLGYRECAVVFAVSRPEEPTLEEIQNGLATCRNIEVWRGVGPQGVFWDMSVLGDFIVIRNGLRAEPIGSSCTPRETAHCTVALP